MVCLLSLMNLTFKKELLIKRGLATLEDQIITYKKNEVLFTEEIGVLKREAACKDYEINVLKSEFEKVKQEKDGMDFKINKFDKASKDLDQLLGSQITNKSKKGLGYSAVPPPHPLIYNRPKNPDMSYFGLDEFKEPEFKGYGPENSEQESNVVCDKKLDISKENSDESLVDRYNFKEFDGGYVTFGGGAYGGRTTGTSEVISQDCIVMPIWKDTSYFDSPTKDVDNGEPKTINDAQKQVEDGPNNENAEQERFADDSSAKDVNDSVNTASSNEHDSPEDMFTMGVSSTLEATHIESFSDEDEPEVDLGNITNSYTFPTIPNTRIHKDHPIDNVIGDVKSSVQTRRMTKLTSEQGFLSDVYEQKTHDTLNTCLYACFLSQIEPTSIAKALSDSSWVKAMLGNKWVFKNKKDERDIVIRNKASFLKKFNSFDCEVASTPVDLEQPLVKDGDANDVDGSPFELVPYTDSDYAGATQDRKSTTRGCQFLGNRLISWQCKKQTVVATSTTEAEYVASLVVVASIWIKTNCWVIDLLTKGSGPRCQDTILGDVDAQTRFEITSKQSNDPPLSRGYTLGSGEDSMKLLN
ncbi:hypothetical protein Tco_0656591 [Tanacetum coccineum]|uniref:Uncharacterized protein n=1 Tax=Tanacetum coccineum TaxID=301880 RepID=A0ABQ4X9M3_9ASTR